MYVLKGTMYVKQYGKTHILKGGDSILMKLTDQHTYYSDQTDVAHILWFHFRGECILPVLNCLYQHQQLPIISHGHVLSPVIFQCMDLAAALPDDYEYRISALIYPVLIDLMKPAFLAIQNETHKKNSWFVDKINWYIDEHIYEKITLNDFSAFMNMSKCYFCRIFKNYFSLSPLQYVMTKKISLSKHLLINSDQSLESIAHALGFSDQSHFSKTFRQYEGTSPLRYRNAGNPSSKSDREYINSDLTGKEFTNV